jgi:hypothetical protein
MGNPPYFERNPGLLTPSNRGIYVSASKCSRLYYTLLPFNDSHRQIAAL